MDKPSKKISLVPRKADPESGLYRFIRDLLIKPWLNIYFKDRHYVGLEKINHHQPTLWVGNHQNAFMDAFLPIAKIRRSVWSLTRGDIFAKPWVAWLLNRMCLIPVYRKQDGPDFNEKTIKSFARVKSLFKERNIHAIIFAEANAKAESRLRPLTSGFARLAFDSAFDPELGNPELCVQPYSVQYEEHTGFRRTVRIELHDPIPMKKYKDLYEKEPRKAILALKKETSDALKKGLIHVPTDAPYTAEKFMQWLSSRFYEDRGLKSNFARSLDIWLPGNMPDQISDDEILVHRMPRLQKPISPIVFPFQLLFSLFAAIHVIPAFILAESQVKKLRDPQFPTSIRFAISMLLSRLLIFLVWLPFIAILLDPYIAFAWLLLLPLSRRTLGPLIDWYFDRKEISVVNQGN